MKPMTAPDPHRGPDPDPHRGPDPGPHPGAGPGPHPGPGSGPDAPPPGGAPDPDDAPGEATLLLRRLSGGDADASGDLLQLLYRELRRIASRQMGGERGDHTLQPTALVHEAWMRLFEGESPEWQGRSHFLRLASRAMRRVLVDHARSRAADKRGGGAGRVALDDVLAEFEERRIDVLALDVALERLTKMDAQLARIVEARFFAGLTIEETARTLEVGTATVERGWRVARMWLSNELRQEGLGDGA